MMQRGALATIAVLAALAYPILIGATGAAVQMAGTERRALEAVESSEALPLATLLPMVNEIAPGEVIDTELTDTDGTLVYLVKVLEENGNIRILRLDAKTGQLL